MKNFGIRSMVSSLLLCCTIFSAAFTQAADWPCWRGANRNGLSSETGLLREWSEESQPVLLWKNTTVGSSTNGVAVFGNLVYTIGIKGGAECVMCIDNQSGKTLWTRPIGKPYGGKKGKFPVMRSTPTVYKNFLYVMSSGGNLVCLNAGDGMIRWTLNLVMNLGGMIPQGGYCESPYVDGKWVIVCPGGPNATMVAIDRYWTRNIWVARTGMPAGYSSIIKASFGREHQYVSYTGGGVLGVKVKGGDVRWTYEAPAHESGFNACPPIWFGQTILASGANGTGCVWVQKDGTAYKTQEVWFNEDLQIPAGDMIKVNDCVFACTDADGLVCFNYKTGKKTWTDQSLFAEAFEEEVDDSDSKKSRKKRSVSLNLLQENGTASLVDCFRNSADSALMPESALINSPILGQEEDAEDRGGRTVEIKAAPKSRKKKKAAAPPDVPKCMGTFAYAEGLLYLRTSMGELALLEASAEGFKLRGKIKIPQMKKGLTTAPVIANGCLYLREGNALFCFDLRDQSRKDGAKKKAEGSESESEKGQKPLPGMPDSPNVKQRRVPKLG